MALTDFLFNGAPPPSVTSESVSTPTLPDWYSDLAKNIVAKGSAIAGAPYQPYTGQAIAERTPLQEQANTMVAGMVGQQQPALGAAQATQMALSDPNLTGLNAEIARLGTRNLSENLLPAIDQTFIGAGQFGGGRQQEFQSRALRDTSANILGAQAQAMLQGNQQALTAARDLMSGATVGQNLGIQQAAALEAAGKQQQAQTQANLDYARQQFGEERDYPREQTYYLSNLLRGNQPPAATVTSGTAPYSGNAMGASGLSTLLAGTLTAGALSNMFAPRPGAGNARGGQVAYRARGGPISPLTMRFRRG